MDRSSSDQREAWGLGESETAPQRTPAAISSSRPRDHLASSKRRLASPGSTRHPARGQQRFCEFVTQPPGTRGSWGVSRRTTAVVPPAARPSRHTSGQRIPTREHGRRRTHRSGAPVSAFPARGLVGRRWFTLAARPRSKGFASLRNQTACRVKRQASSAPEGRWKNNAELISITPRLLDGGCKEGGC